jgi:hypothetical protein
MTTKTRVSNTRLNVVQMHLLKMFSHTRTQKSLEDLKELLARYYSDLIKNEADEIWNSKGLTNNDMDEILNTHRRTPYNR